MDHKRLEREKESEKSTNSRILVFLASLYSYQSNKQHYTFKPEGFLGGKINSLFISPHLCIFSNNIWC